MSKVVKTGITYFFMVLVQKIFRGRVIPTVIGAIVGGAIGALGWYLHSSLMPPLIFFGLIVGAAIAAAIFPKPQSSSTAEEALQE
jgi:large-conductance mechanosensitive channel